MNRACLTAAALLPATALAHEGHGFSSAMSIVHYVVEPEHMVPLLIGAALAGGWRRLRARARGTEGGLGRSRRKPRA